MDAKSYEAIATGPFAPLYPFYAEWILAQAGPSAGRCLDVGCGGGHLGLAVAERSGMDLYLLDQSAEMIAIARATATVRALPGKVELLHAPVHAIPLADDAVDLVVSRGSISFWEDLPKALREIYRVLAPGGYACMGGGLGTPDMREAIMRDMQTRNPSWADHVRSVIPKHSVGYYAGALDEAAIPLGTVTRGDTGTWVEFRKK
jgi:ubiquinone/menaquinone biosynthesis C-methylase UbiE